GIRDKLVTGVQTCALPIYLRRETGRIDYWGLGMLAVGIGALQFVLDKGQEEDWFASNTITTLAIIAAITLIGLVYHELTTEHPEIGRASCRERAYTSEAAE